MADFLAQLKGEYMQQLFYATVEQKNLPWLNQGLADPAITGLIVKTPINPPKTADTLASNRDRLTGLPLDDKGRYEVNLTLGDKSYSPKYFPCATAECVKSGGNLDMSDAETRGRSSCRRRPRSIDKIGRIWRTISAVSCRQARLST